MRSKKHKMVAGERIGAWGSRGAGRFGESTLRCWCQSLGPDWGDWEEGDMGQPRDQGGETERTQSWAGDGECQRGKCPGDFLLLTENISLFKLLFTFVSVS